MERWFGKLAIVTGAGGGIGGKICESFLKSGIHVIGVDVELKNVFEISQKLIKEKGKLHPFQFDLTKANEIEAGFNRIRAEFGPVHILVNCAGIFELTDALNTDPKTWTQILDVNVLGLSVCTSEAVKIMQKEHIKGQIININSVTGHKVVDRPGLYMYNASKYAVTALTESLRLELNREKSKIKVTSISPGAVQTQLLTKGKDKVEYMETIQPEDVANAILFVLSTPEHVEVRELTIGPFSGVL